MANQKKIYILCPTWDYHPDGPLQLGSIILSPANPAEALNPGADRVPPPDNLCFPPMTKTSVAWSRERLLSGRYGVWTKFLSAVGGLGLGLDASFGHDAAVTEDYAFDSVETVEFLPTTEYLERSMQAAPAAVSFLEKSRLRKHVYMITALKTVRGARAKSYGNRSNSVTFGVTLDRTAVPLPASTTTTEGPIANTRSGPRALAEWSGRADASFDGGSDFVFAFRLRKIVVHPRSKTITHAAYTSGAMYGEDRLGQAAELPFIVEGVEEEDASAETFGWGASAETVVDEDHECICVRARAK